MVHAIETKNMQHLCEKTYLLACWLGGLLSFLAGWPAAVPFLSIFLFFCSLIGVCVFLQLVGWIGWVGLVELLGFVRWLASSGLSAL